MGNRRHMIKAFAGRRCVNSPEMIKVIHRFFVGHFLSPNIFQIRLKNHAPKIDVPDGNGAAKRRKTHVYDILYTGLL
jgi:hypothetical protein